MGSLGLIQVPLTKIYDESFVKLLTQSKSYRIIGELNCVYLIQSYKIQSHITLTLTLTLAQ